MQLLKTKFHIPEFNFVSNIARTRISALINDNSTIVIISAPAGFGKTTLLSEWVKGCKTKVAWVSLEKSENIPSVFWHYIITAISSVSNNCGKNALAKLKSSGASLIENILIDLINNLAENNSEFTLILDDYHVITDCCIHKGIEFLIDHLPLNMRIIIAGREDPQLAISKFRISGKLLEIRAAQLRFNSFETETFLNQIHSLKLNKEDILSLKNKTEGWITGLVLAVLSIRGQKNIKTFIDDFTGSHRYILDYLIEEVLSGLSDEVKDFMLKISIAERFCPSLCHKISGNANSRKILNNMEQNNLFLIPLDNQRQWFRYHHLFREFLIKTLRETKPGEIKKSHEKAFYWLRDNDFLTEALNHGLLAKNYADTAELLAEKTPELFSDSGGFMLKSFIDRLPEKIVQKNSVLCSYHVWLNTISGNFKSLKLLHNDIFREDKTVKGFISLIKSYQYFYQPGEFEKSIKEIKISLQILPEKHLSIREMGELIYSLSLSYSGDIRSAYNYTQNLISDDHVPVVRAISHAHVLLSMGKLESALCFINNSIEKGKLKYGENLLPEYGYLYSIKGNILRERNQIQEALKACRQGLYLSRNNEYIEFVFLGNLEYARILASDENYPEAEKAIQRSMKAAKASSTWGQFMTAAYKIRIEILKGKLKIAEELLNRISDFSSEKIPFYKYYEYLSFCRFCICKKETKPVHEITALMIKEDLTTQRNARLLECYILKSIAFYLDNKIENALNTLQKAFKLSEEEGHVRIYIDEGENINKLFKLAFSRKLLPKYLTPYLDKNSEKQAETNKDTIVIINEFKENFNEREIEILKLMKKGCSNKIIADTLFISVNTVKWYASRIFAKLDAKRRGEAVSYAEKYELI